MATIILRLEEDDWQSLHNMAVAMFLDGQCYEFSMALHRDLGWPMIGLMKENVIWHSVAQAPDGNLWDVRGLLDRQSCGDHFQLRRPYVFKNIERADLFKTRQIYEENVDRASLMAQALWPEFPWKAHTLQKRALAFMDDLEELCNKHNVWVRAPVSTEKIVLGQKYGEEAGFEISPTLDGQYFFDRYLNRAFGLLV